MDYLVYRKAILEQDPGNENWFSFKHGTIGHSPLKRGDAFQVSATYRPE